MRRVYRVGLGAVLALAAAMAPALAGDVTVGHFYVELAKAKNLVAADAVSAEANLRQAGFNLPRLGLNKGLTEGDMMSISSVFGLSVKTQQPNAPISEAQLGTFMSSFRSQIAAPGIKQGDPATVQDLPPQSGKGKGKKKGHHKSSSEPI